MSHIDYKWGCLHEITGRQAFNCPRWPQDKREPRGCLLEGAEGDRRRSPHDVVGFGRRDRCATPARQSLIGASAVRVGFLSQSGFRKGQPRWYPRDDGPSGVRVFLNRFVTGFTTLSPSLPVEMNSVRST